MLTFAPTTAFPYLVTNIFDPYLPSSSSTTATVSSPATHSCNTLSSKNSKSVSTQTAQNFDEFTLIVAAVELISISDEFGTFLDSQKSSKSSTVLKYISFSYIFDFTLRNCF